MAYVRRMWFGGWLLWFVSWHLGRDSHGELACIQRYWDLESQLRQLTEKMTAREKADLNDLMPTQPQREAMKMFGHPDTVKVMEEWAVELMQEFANPLVPGRVVNPKEELWTVLKGLMKARHGCQDRSQFAACECLCRSHFMPMGCGCKDFLGTGKVDSRLCEQCSTCLRCGRLLGFGLMHCWQDSEWVSSMKIHNKIQKTLTALT